MVRLRVRVRLWVGCNASLRLVLAGIGPGVPIAWCLLKGGLVLFDDVDER